MSFPWLSASNSRGNWEGLSTSFEGPGDEWREKGGLSEIKVSQGHSASDALSPPSVILTGNFVRIQGTSRLLTQEYVGYRLALLGHVSGIDPVRSSG